MSLRLHHRIALASTVLVALGVFASPERAYPRVNPLNFIKRQIHKPNLLIVLDTSGSMTGVPGSAFKNSSEVGVDCDQGRNCRGWDAEGACSSTQRPCASHAECQASYCEIGHGPCLSADDCPDEGTCSEGGAICVSDDDCASAGWGTCSLSKEVCNNAMSCPVVGVCTTTKNACTNIGKQCKAGYCSSNGAKACASDSDCAGNGAGVCKYGVTPSAGCKNDTQCPAIKRCDTGETCTNATDCPAISVGYCSKKKSKTCTKDCGKDGSCVFPQNLCTSEANECLLSFGTCKYLTGNAAKNNKCKSDNNVCTPGANTCVITHKNACVPAPGGESCKLGATALALKMCQNKQTLCASDADCPPGDTCGPPSSRAVVAKRALSRVIEDSSSIVNFGLMTFYQSQYFPYYRTDNAVPSGDVVFITKGHLEGPCFSVKGGPTSTCEHQGAKHTLIAGPSSQYVVNNNGTKIYHDMPWCGFFCEIPGKGTGRYLGSYFIREGVTGVVSKTKKTMESYTGKTIKVGSEWYQYYDAPNNFYNGGSGPPIKTVSCNLACSATCGARWDEQLGPFIKPNASDAESQASARAILSWMEKASYGGLVTYGTTPSGCTLENDVEKSRNASAYHYMQELKGDDTLPCRQNFVLFLTDGEANGPGDAKCTDTRCSQADPEKAGCTCRVVLSAYHLRKDLGVRTFVVGFSSDVAVGSARIINDNVARAGGTDYGNDGASPFAFIATNENELISAIQNAIFDAVRGSYATSPATSSSGEQLSGSVKSGEYALDSRVDFPSWEGHLLAYDVTVEPPTIVWNANEQLRKMNWWERRVYVGSRDGSVVRIKVDPGTKSITNRDTLYNLGMGSSTVEAEKIGKFMLADPASGNKAVLGAIINSTPIDVGQPGDSVLPGGRAFFLAHKARPNLTYVGASDGMLHAFFTKDTVVDGDVHPAGSEAFAYVPPSMLSVVTNLYAQGGQVADPRQHIFGLASSPKVKNVCVTNCTDAEDAIWRTVLVMNEGYGGNGMFALDITNPVSDTGFSDPPVLPLWHSDNPDLESNYEAHLGQSISVPAFTFHKSNSLNDYRLVFASGYAVDESSSSQGRRIVNASLNDGEILGYAQVSSSNGCARPYALLADVASSRDFKKDEFKKSRAAYVGDTWGSLWRFDGTAVSPLANFGCDHPLHFAPTVVQLDRDDPDNHRGDAYLVQVTNSSLDDDTATLPPSRLVIMKERLDDKEALHLDDAFGDKGQLTLTVGTPELCGATAKGGGCTSLLPTTARPTTTPLAILKKDGSGFQMMSMWYAQDLNGCSKGVTWLALHEVVGNKATQIQGLKVADEPVTSPVVVNGRILVVGSQGTVDIGGDIEASFSAGNASPTSNIGAGIFRMLGWMEVQ